MNATIKLLYEEINKIDIMIMVGQTPERKKELLVTHSSLIISLVELEYQNGQLRPEVRDNVQLCYGFKRRKNQAL